MVVGKYDKAANHINECSIFRPAWVLFLAFLNDSPDYKSDHISSPQAYFSWVSGKLTSSVRTTARILHERIQSMSTIKSTTSKLLPNGAYPGGFEDSGPGEEHMLTPGMFSEMATRESASVPKPLRHCLGHFAFLGSSLQEDGISPSAYKDYSPRETDWAGLPPWKPLLSALLRPQVGPEMLSLGTATDYTEITRSCLGKSCH